MAIKCLLGHDYFNFSISDEDHIICRKCGDILNIPSSKKEEIYDVQTKEYD